MTASISVPERGTADLSATQWDQLARVDVFWALVDAKIIVAENRRGGRARLRGSCYVGRALCGDVVLECREKVDGALLALLDAAIGNFKLLRSPSPATELGPTIALIVRAFVAEVRQYVGNGREWRYDHHRTVSSLVSGRMHVPTTVGLRARGMRHLVAFDRPAISYAVDLNRIVFAALREVEVLSRLADLPPSDVSTARAMSLFFDDCRDPDTLSGSTTALAARAADLLEGPDGDRHNAMLALAGVLLSHNSFEPTTPLLGGVPLSWFLNLEILFERAVRQRLRAVTAPNVSVNKGAAATTPIFRETGTLVADPDLVVRSPTKTVVGDVKYKNWTGVAEPSDMYQLLTHAAAFGADIAFLVYPSDQFEAFNLGHAATGPATWLFAVDIRALDDSLMALCAHLDIAVQDLSYSATASAPSPSGA